MKNIIFVYIFKNKTVLLNYFIYSIITIISSIITLIIPLITSNILNIITSLSENLYNLYTYILLYGILSLISIIFSIINSRIYAKVQTQVAFGINRSAIIHLHNISKSTFPNKPSSYITQRVNEDSNVITSFLIALIPDIIINSLYLVFSGYILFRVSKLIFIITIFLMLLYLIVYIFSKEKIFKYDKNLKEEQSTFFSIMNQEIDYYNFIKTHSISNWFISLLDNSFNKLFSTAIKFQTLIAVYSSISKIIILLGSLTLYFIGGNLVIEKNIKIGIFVAAISYFQLMLNSTEYFSNLGKEYQTSKVSLARLEELFDLPKQKNGNIKLQNINTIKITDLSFDYQEKKLFSKYNQCFEKGKIYVIKGNNGIGKTTLLNILAGMYTDIIKNGSIKYNSIDIKKIDTNDLLHNKISIVEQNPIYFEDTLLNNLLLDQNISLDILTDLITEVFGDVTSKFILENIQTESSFNNNLSGGEKQKISIIRGILKFHEVLILDEPTSSLDFQSIFNLLEFLKKSKNNKITIIISHDNKVFQIADQIVNLK